MDRMTSQGMMSLNDDDEIPEHLLQSLMKA